MTCLKDMRYFVYLMTSVMAFSDLAFVIVWRGYLQVSGIMASKLLVSLTGNGIFVTQVLFLCLCCFIIVSDDVTAVCSPHTHTHTLVKQPFFRDYPGEPVPER